MPKNNVLEMTNDIQNFIDSFESKYGQFIRVTLGVDKSRITKEVDHLKTIEQLCLDALHHRHPEYSHVKSLKYKSRKLGFMKYKQCFCLIAFNCGYKKSHIGVYLDQTHATIINSIVFNTRFFSLFG